MRKKLCFLRDEQIDIFIDVFMQKGFRAFVFELLFFLLAWTRPCSYIFQKPFFTDRTEILHFDYQNGNDDHYFFIEGYCDIESLSIVWKKEYHKVTREVYVNIVHILTWEAYFGSRGLVYRTDNALISNVLLYWVT